MLSNIIILPVAYANCNTMQTTFSETNIVLQIKLSVAAIRNVRGLPFLDDFKKRVALVDLFDWLQFCFGFQVNLICFFHCDIFSVFLVFIVHPSLLTKVIYDGGTVSIY